MYTIEFAPDNLLMQKWFNRFRIPIGIFYFFAVIFGVYLLRRYPSINFRSMVQILE